jgi:hypothetical protein
MTTQARRSKHPLATNGERNPPLFHSTSWFDTICNIGPQDLEQHPTAMQHTPAAVATKPLTRVARPMIVLKSSLCSAASELEDTSQLSNAENNMEVDIPPKTRAKRSNGKNGKSRRPHVIAYRTQNNKQIRLRPLCSRERSKKQLSEELVDYSLRVCPNTDKWSEDGGADKACHKQDSDLPFREGVLLAIERVDIWALQPIGTFWKDQHHRKT